MCNEESWTGNNVYVEVEGKYFNNMKMRIIVNGILLSVARTTKAIELIWCLVMEVNGRESSGADCAILFDFIRDLRLQ